jgi:hypothetical protein
MINRLESGERYAMTSIRRTIASLTATSTVIASLGALSLATAGASAAAVRPTIASPEQAAYVATGARFRYIQTTVALPDASQFASEIGSYGLSVQLWSGDKILVLGISTCTTANCAPGGTPAKGEPYNAAVAVFDRATGEVLHSATNSPAMAPGDSVTLSAFYDRTAGTDTFTVTDTTASTSFTDTYQDPSATYRQARAGAEFATDPFHTAPYDAPADPVHLVRLSGIRVTDYSAQRGGFSSPHWDHAKVNWTRNGKTTGAVDGHPRDLFSAGTAFNIYLEP